ncbi:hypothetical protein [Catellatospora tritici]|uniref:hypothetical protein n=1 Tax=Catellatospora tritici TaxID=2851566 RepID=UPI001C2D825F|nr:hypothetical protein [Catellatospora tritici]MBV1850735.1 hypothetical protein [Catellatospora tritici]MBV1850988.1 hypothetical protein [Catellatospora tritici]
MGTSSAIPENLLAYANRCVPADEGLRDLVLGQLRPAILTFFSRNVPRDDGQNIDLGPLRARLGGVCTTGSVDARLLATANDAARLDAWVKLIGRGFQIAGEQGPPLQGPLPQGQKWPVVFHADDDALGNLAANLTNDSGADLAAKAKAGANDPAVIKWVSEQLGLHGNDPYYLAAVFNNLDPNDIARLLRDPANGKLLAYAFAKNLITPEAAAKIVEAISHISGGYEISPEHQYIPADSRNALLKYLAADPAAAKYFLNAIGTDGWKKLMNLYAGAPVPGSHSYPLEVLQTVLADTKDPAEVQRLLDLLAENLPGNVDEKEFEQIKPLLQDILRTNVPKLLGPMPPASDNIVELQDWVNKYAIAMDGLKKFGDWVDSHYEDVTKRNQFFPQLFLSITVDLATEKLTGLLPGGKLTELSVDQLMGLLPDWQGKLLDLLEVKPGDDIDPHKFPRTIALSGIIHALAEQGRIKLPGQDGKVTWAQLEKDPDFKKMFEAFIDNQPPEDKDKYDDWFKKRRGLLQWAQKYHIDGGTLFTVVDTLDNNMLA